MRAVRNVDLEGRAALDARIAELVERVKRAFEADVYLFGSFTTGEIHEGSDIDMLVVGNFSGRMPERIGEILSMTDLPVEPLCYTRKEFSRLRRTSSFLKAVLGTARMS